MIEHVPSGLTVGLVQKKSVDAKPDDSRKENAPIDPRKPAAANAEAEAAEAGEAAEGAEEAEGTGADSPLIILPGFTFVFGSGTHTIHETHLVENDCRSRRQNCRHSRR